MSSPSSVLQSAVPANDTEVEPSSVERQKMKRTLWFGCPLGRQTRLRHCVQTALRASASSTESHWLRWYLPPSSYVTRSWGESWTLGSFNKASSQKQPMKGSRLSRSLLDPHKPTGFHESVVAIPAKLSANAGVEELLVLTQVIVFQILAQLLPSSASERLSYEITAKQALCGSTELHVRPIVAKNLSVRTLIRPLAPNALPRCRAVVSVQDLSCPLRRDAVAMDAVRRIIAAQQMSELMGQRQNRKSHDVFGPAVATNAKVT